MLCEKLNMSGLTPDIHSYMQHFSKKIVDDETATQLVFLTALSAYTNDPINLFLKGPSSIGKTYITTTVVKMFPKEDVWMLGGLSPKALIHLHAQLVDENLQPIDLDQKPSKDADLKDVVEWREKLRHAKYLIDLSKKILVFLEAPSIDTFMMLRPILSHDEFQIEYKFVTETLRTRTVVIQGWPATIFCTTSEKYIEELATRSITVSPVESEEKYKRANILAAEQAMFPQQSDEHEQNLKSYLASMRNFMDTPVFIPFAKQLADIYPTKLPRAMRDFKMLLRLIKTNAAFHLFHRVSLVIEKSGMETKRYILADARDAYVALSLFYSAWETTVSGLPEGVLDFYYHGCLEAAGPDLLGFHSREAILKYRTIRKQDISYRTAMRYLDQLVNAGYLDEEPDPDDKRTKLYYPRKKPENPANSCQAVISGLFSPDSLKNWLEQLMTSCQSTHGSDATIKLVDNLTGKQITVDDYVNMCLNWHGVINSNKPENKELSQNS